MSLTLSQGRAQQPQRPSSGRAVLDIAFVNNMPDAALRSTERQFTAAVGAAAGHAQVHLHRYTLPGVERGPDAQAALAGYASTEDLPGRSFDALIVTGNEPRAARLDAEPYWRHLARLVEWAEMHTVSSLWSCLAAHAAVLHLHGIERRPLAAKLAGVFTCRVERVPLATGISPTMAVPHSRWNELRRDDLLAHGYEIISESPEAGVDAFSLRLRSQFVFLQGHPEYDTDTLLREYRRDVGRYLRGERRVYPDEPAHYFSDEAISILRAYKRRCVTHRDPRLFDVFPNVATPAAITNRWQRSTGQFYRNWLTGIAAAKASRAA